MFTIPLESLFPFDFVAQGALAFVLYLLLSALAVATVGYYMETLVRRLRGHGVGSKRLMTAVGITWVLCMVLSALLGIIVPNPEFIWNN